MNLFLITSLNGLAVLFLGAALLWNHHKIEQGLKAFPRSRPATVIIMVVATAWFLFHVSRLGEADYGNYRHYLALAFLAVALLSFYFVPDFLAVRGAAALLLLIAHVNLMTAYMQWEHPQRLVLVTFTYGLILLALYLAISPFRVRDFFSWMFAQPGRARIIGGILATFGLLLCGLGISMA